MPRELAAGRNGFRYLLLFKARMPSGDVVADKCLRANYMPIGQGEMRTKQRTK